MKPILFSYTMVQALLSNIKSQTRRVIKPQPIDNREVDGNFYEGNHKGYVKVDGHPNWRDQFVSEFSPYEKGNILYVRETHFRFGKWVKDGVTKKGGQKWKFTPLSNNIHFEDNPPATFFKSRQANNERGNWEEMPTFYKRNSLFMPKKLARIFLEITNVRVERLQEISKHDSIAEGVESIYFKQGLFGKELQRPDRTLAQTEQSCMEHLWVKINGKESWEANPWVWVIEFKKRNN